MGVRKRRGFFLPHTLFEDGKRQSCFGGWVGRTFTEPRLTSIMDNPGSIALAVANLRTEAEGEAETPTARAPLNTAFQDDER